MLTQRQITGKETHCPSQVATEGPSEWLHTVFPEDKHSWGVNASDKKGERNHLPAAENGWSKEHRAYHLALPDLKQREKRGYSIGAPPTSCSSLRSPGFSQLSKHVLLSVCLPNRTRASWRGRLSQAQGPGTKEAPYWRNK